jgi:hypothetical protein
MNSTIETSPLITMILDGLSSLAETLSLPVVLPANATALRQTFFRAAVEAQRVDPPNKFDVPSLKAESLAPGLHISHYSVIIAELGESLAEAEDYFYRAEYQAAVALSWLSGKRREDLHLFLVGPLGSGDDAEWIDYGARIERDERVCRKLTWLPTRDDPQRSLQHFLDRTFLARPWHVLRQQDQPSLDPINEVVKLLESDGDLQRIEPSILRRWIRILTDPSDDNGLVDDLIGAIGDVKQ